MIRSDACKLLQHPWLPEEEDLKKKKSFHNHDDKSCSSSSYTSSIGEESMEEDDDEDDDDSVTSPLNTPSSSSSSSSPSSSPSSPFSSVTGRRNLYDLSEIMAQLPIKRGLSKFYEGKSESFTSLSSVTSTEDLAKKNSTMAVPYSCRRNLKLKASKSCGNGLNSSYKAKAIISKRNNSSIHSRVSSLSSFSTKRGSFIISTKPPMVPPLHKN
ncbi:protein OXIDATIVE STRESS 3-like [Andrographis paniculata]|uniref:protein OXIDATIVE STRESS 3-like n=1 Tax=Andrographis paniculata TaxID=175694 RepID=UPI0021E9853F|nr:protein OXIDATIVE STRESS 3-like [Andrographis paniculata]